jgi:hypothetical protein
MRHSLLIILILLIATVYSCSDNALPDHKFIFSDKYWNLIQSFKVGDTLLYKNNSEQIETFIISRSGSNTFNTSSSYSSQRAYKNVTFSYNQLPARQRTDQRNEKDANNKAAKTTYEDDELISFIIYPDKGEEICNISFKNFRGKISKQNDKMLSKPITANGLTFNDYYKVENIASDLAPDPRDIKVVYLANDKGIIAYQDQQGNWWTQMN